MKPARRHSIWPCLTGIAGHHITQHGDSLSTWDLRVDARNGDAVTVDDITLAEAQAFIKCLHRVLIHDAPAEAEGGAVSPDELRVAAGLSGGFEPPPPPDGPPANPSSSPRTDPPSAGPEPAAARAPLATGGWIPPGAAMQVTTAMVRAGEYVLPGVPPGGACYGGEWIVPPGNPWPSLPGHQAQFEVRFDQTGPLPATHVMPQVVHVGPGEVISVTCSCQTIAGGTLADDPNCRMHHGVPTVYVFDGR